MGRDIAMEQIDIKFFDPDKIRIYIDENGEFILEDKIMGECFKGIEIKALFPVTRKANTVSVFHDRKELGIILDYKKLDDVSRETVEKIINETYFIPEIVKIYKIEEENRLSSWDIATDKGEVKIQVHHGRDVSLRGSKAYIRDNNGNLYIIRDINKLDVKSGKMLMAYV